MSDYYPFGYAMGGRSVSSSGYRYGFNGKEKDQNGEWGNQTHYDYGFRIYNPAIGKFLSVDPLTKAYPWYTPYQFAGNKPIKFIDLDGLEETMDEFSADGIIQGLGHGDDNGLAKKPEARGPVKNAVYGGIGIVTGIIGGIIQSIHDGGKEAIGSAVNSGLEAMGSEQGAYQPHVSGSDFYDAYRRSDEAAVYYSLREDAQILRDNIPNAVGEAGMVILETAFFERTFFGKTFPEIEVTAKAIKKTITAEKGIGLAVQGLPELAHVKGNLYRVPKNGMTWKNPSGKLSGPGNFVSGNAHLHIEAEILEYTRTVQAAPSLTYTTSVGNASVPSFLMKSAHASTHRPTPSILVGGNPVSIDWRVRVVFGAGSVAGGYCYWQKMKQTTPKNSNNSEKQGDGPVINNAAH